MNRIDYILTLEEKVELKIKEFNKKYSVNPQYIKLGWGINNGNFKIGDKLNGLEIRLDEENSFTFEVGISL